MPEHDLKFLRCHKLPLSVLLMAEQHTFTRLKKKEKKRIQEKIKFHPLNNLGLSEVFILRFENFFTQSHLPRTKPQQMTIANEV